MPSFDNPPPEMVAYLRAAAAKTRAVIGRTFDPSTPEDYVERFAMKKA
ncbi:MAG: hypothetical protein ACXWKC_09875 [Xanthobacteraceae bacterium]